MTRAPPLDHFELHGKPPVGFELARLEPTDPRIERRKARVRAKRIAFRTAAILAVALPVAWFSTVAAVVVAAIGFAVWGAIAYLCHLGRTSVAPTAAEVAAENPLLGGLLKMAEVMEDVEEDVERERDIIDSWDDDEERAA